MSHSRALLGLAVLLAGVVPPTQAHAQTPNQERTYFELARVLEVKSQTVQDIPGTQTPQTLQTLSALILSGPDKGQTVTIENDYLELAPGDRFYANHTVGGMEALDDTWNVQEPYRLPTLGLLIGLFVVAVLVFGGKQGIRGLLSLVASLAAIVWLLLPGILAGYSPVLLAVAISALIVGVGSYVTHGFNRTTTAAVLGMIVTIACTGGLAYWAVHASLLSGFSSDEVTYLHFATNGGIDFVGLLLGGMLIGVLGILYDAAIGQAVAVEELRRAAAHYTPWQLYTRAERIGREHIGALVNTLAIAYVGASLPLLLLLHFSEMGFATTVNQEVFATEIVRIMVGSIGLVLAVPVTTVIAIAVLREENPSAGAEGHAHRHSHGA
jgi:uncharacterized membrane protein